MKKFREQFKKEAEKISLDKKEQAILRERVLSFMEYHPLSSEKTLEKEEWSTVNFKSWRVFQWSSLALLISLTTIPYLAEKSIPGDALYAVKVNFNEEVRSSLSFNSYDKIVWETERLNRRISEINLLTIEGKMTDKIEDGAVEAVKNHSDRAKREIESLKKSDQDGATMAAVQLDAVIDMQSVNLRQVSDQKSGSSSVSAKIIKILDEESLNNKAFLGNTAISWNRLTAHVEKETTRAYELLKNVEKSANKKEQANIKRRLDDIGRKIEVAAGKRESSEEESIKLMFDVLGDTQKLITYIVNIDIDANFDIEKVVPITLTKEEKVSEIRNDLKTSQDLMAKFELVLATSSKNNLSKEVKEKITAAVEFGQEKIAEIEPVLEEDEFDLKEAKEKMTAVLNILKDAEVLLKENNVPLTENNEEKEGVENEKSTSTAETPDINEADDKESLSTTSTSSKKDKFNKDKNSSTTKNLKEDV